MRSFLIDSISLVWSNFIDSSKLMCLLDMVKLRLLLLPFPFPLPLFKFCFRLFLWDDFKAFATPFKVERLKFFSKALLPAVGSVMMAPFPMGSCAQINIAPYYTSIYLWVRMYILIYSYVAVIFNDCLRPLLWDDCEAFAASFRFVVVAVVVVVVVFDERYKKIF
jgi:hypothetical protein